MRSMHAITLSVVAATAAAAVIVSRPANKIRPELRKRDLNYFPRVNA